MKKLIAGLFVFLVAGFLAATYFSISFLLETKGLIALSSQQTFSKGTGSPRYHFAAFLPQREDPFFTRLTTSLEYEAQIQEVAIEIHRIPYSATLSEVAQALETAILSRVDGIILYAPEQDNLKKIVNLSVDSGIPLVTVESDSGASKRQSYIGTNSFQLGLEAGLLTREARPTGSQVGVILTQADNYEETTKTSLLLSGLGQALRGRPGNQLVVVKTSPPGIFSGEAAAYDILTKYPQVNVIFAASSKDTIAAAQAMVDLNRVAEVILIGLDDDELIRNLIRKKILYGTVVRSPSQTAHLVLLTLEQWIEKKNASSYLDPGLSVLTLDKLTAPGSPETGGYHAR